MVAADGGEVGKVSLFPYLPRYIGDVFIIQKIEASFVPIEKNFKFQGINCYASRVPVAAWTASVLFL